MPIIDFTNPAMEIIALILFLLCLFLGRNTKTNTAMCIALLCFVTILVVHTVELGNATDVDIILKIVRCIIIDEVFTFVSFLSFLWLDKIQIEDKQSKNKKSKKNKKGKEKIEDKEIEDGLDILWKKV